MTWNETHARTRIIREVEAAAAADMSGAVPWREEWAPYFNGPAGLVAALRARWNHMCEAQLDVRTNEDDVNATYTRLRRSEAGVLAILRRADSGSVTPVLIPAPRHLPAPRTRARRFTLARGPVLPV